MFARPCSLKQFMDECGVEDVFLDVLALGSPSGHMSRRSEKVIKARLSVKQEAWFHALAAYEYFLDSDFLWDPTGEFLNGQSRLARNQLRQAENYEHHADVLTQMASLHPRAYPKEAARLRALALEVRARINPKAIV